MLKIPVESLSKLILRLTYVQSNSCAVTICDIQKDNKINPIVSPLYACLIQLETDSYISYYIYLLDILHIQCINHIEIRECFLEKGISVFKKPSLLADSFGIRSIMYTIDSRYCTDYNSVTFASLVNSKLIRPNSIYDKWLSDFLGSRELLIELNEIKHHSSYLIDRDVISSNILYKSIREVKEHIEGLFLLTATFIMQDY